jgi:hypothetical protein
MMTHQESNRDSTDKEQDEAQEAETLSTVVRALQSLTPEARQRVLAAVSVFLGIPLAGQHGRMSVAPHISDTSTSTSKFSDDRTPHPKEFLYEKRPQTDLERIACLAYYLTHYRDTPHFKTLDLSKLNTEAAQLKFSNAANAVDNAAKAGFLVPASKGAKQLSALGELYVQALPDREAAREAIAHARPKKRTRRSGKSASQVADEGDEANEQ